MKLKVGKFYRTESGEKVEAVHNDGEIYLPWHVRSETGRMYYYRGDGSTTAEGGRRIVAEWTEPADEIVWGEWGPCSGQAAPWQCQKINGSTEYRYPVKREPVVETVTLGGFLWNCEWHFRGLGKDARQTHRITLTIIDGVVQPTATVEALK